MQSVARSADVRLPPGRPTARRRALSRAIERRLGRLWLVRAGRFGSYYVALAHVGLVVWLLSDARGVDGSALYSRALGYLTLAAALVAVGAAVDLEALERRAGLDGLARLRGLSSIERSVARLTATARLITGTLMVPSLILGVALVAVSGLFADVVARSLRVVAGLAYATLAGGVLAVVSRWCALLAPARPRTLTLAVLVVPHLIHVATGEGPSVLALLERLLDAIEAMAGGIG